MDIKDIIAESDKKDIEMVRMLINSSARAGQSYEEIKVFLTGKFPDTLIDALIQDYKEENDIDTLAASILKSDKNKNKATWYKKIDRPDSRWGKLQNVLRSGNKPWRDEHIKDLDEQSDLVLRNIAAPDGPEGIYKGLVLGYVQSGKTANFSASIAKAIDQGYKIIIVLGGLYNNLRSQTERRLRKEIVAPHGDSGTVCLTDATEKGDFKAPRGIQPANLLSSRAPVFCVIKKNKSPMTSFLNWFKGDDKNAGVDPELLKKSPVLIIDDEADQASVNSNDPEQDRTAINELLVQMLNYFSQSTVTNYIGYTATPFANIFIDAQDSDDIYPEDFIISLKPPKAYNGTEKLFGRASIDGDGGKAGLDIFRFIAPDEVDLIKNISDEASPPDSLKYAIDSYFLACSERILRGQKNEHMTMLIHTSHKKDDHKGMCKVVDEYIRYARTAYKTDPRYQEELKRIWETDFVKLTTTQFEEQEINNFDRVIYAMEIFFQSFWEKTIMENSDSDTRLDFAAHDSVWAIIVGGNTLSRGLTVEGLTVSYFQRTSKGYDTLLQMGRWFGYRAGFLDLTRIFVTQEMHSNFFFLATVESEVRDDIEQMAINGERPRDVSIKVRDHEKLVITGRKTLKNNSVFSARTYSGSKVQARYIFPQNKLINNQNHELIKSFTKSLEQEKGLVQDLYSGHANCLLFKDVESEKVLEFLRNFHISKEDKKSRIELFGPYVEKLNQRGELTNWSVAVHSRKEKDPLREIDINGHKIYSLDRKLAPRLSSVEDHTIFALGQLMAQRDEIIDMKDILGDAFERSLDDNEEGMTFKKVRKLRPKERGLIIIYPLYTHHNMSEEEIEKIKSNPSKSPIISASEVIYSVSMILPFSEVSEMNFNYRENYTVKK